MTGKSRKLVFAAALAAALAAATSAAAIATFGAHAAAAPQQGIKVHGRWTIQIRDRHGRVVRTRRFENALVGGVALANVLGGAETAGPWDIGIGGIQAAWRLQQRYGDLSVTPTGATLVLAGTVPGSQVTVNGTITNVSTEWFRCSSSVAPDQCNGGTPAQFTFRSGLSIPVQPGQAIAVKVVLSFS